MAANLVVRASAPLPFFISRATGAHQPDELGAPDQGAVRESDSAFGPSREINPNILPLDLFLFLILVSYSCSSSELFYHRSMYRACLIMTIITIRLIATITSLV